MARTKSSLGPLPVVVVVSSDLSPPTGRHLDKPSIESISQSMDMLDIDPSRRPSRRRQRRRQQGHRHSSCSPGMTKDDDDAKTSLIAPSLHSSSSFTSIRSLEFSSDMSPLTTRPCHFTDYRHYDEHGDLVDAHRVRESCAAFRRWHACECGASMGRERGREGGMRTGRGGGVSIRHSTGSRPDQRQLDTSTPCSSHLDDRRSQSPSRPSVRHDASDARVEVPSAEHDTVTIERADCPFCQRRRGARGLDVWHFVRLEGQPVDEEIYEGYRRVW